MITSAEMKDTFPKITPDGPASSSERMQEHYIMYMCSLLIVRTAIISLA